MLQSGPILLLTCYELGHQPLSLAWPAAVMRKAGLDVVTTDLAVDSLPREVATRARFVAIAAPMHTALRLGTHAAQEIRALNPVAHVCFFGLYACLNANHLLSTVADSILAGETEEVLAAWAAQILTAGDEPAGTSLTSLPPGVSTRDLRTNPLLTRLTLPVPDRRDLPELSRYARYLAGGRYYLAGYVEASRGCLHTCRHCPVVPVYGGRFFVVPSETVLADVRQQVAAGAEHITFGDPDFLNGPGHVLKIARAIHAEFPGLSFNFTTKVEHILQHRALLRELRSLGAGFVVSAFESVSDSVLRRLRKGHSRANLDDALAILRDADLPVQPTWLPFTPWTTLDDYLDLLDWIRERNLIAHIPPVQLAIRLLVPPGSALLEDGDAGWLGELDEANFGYNWRHTDPCMDELQRAVAQIAEQTDNTFEAFSAIERLAYGFAGRPLSRMIQARHVTAPPPRLTEDWFC